MTADRHFRVEREGATLVISPRPNDPDFIAPVEPELDQVLIELRNAAAEGVVIDLGDLAYFGSTMLAALLTIWKEARARGGKMALCRVSEIGTQVLQIGRFDTLWPIFTTRDEALASLGR